LYIDFLVFINYGQADLNEKKIISLPIIKILTIISNIFILVLNPHMPFEILSSIHTGTCLTSSHLPRQELKRLLKICFLSEFHLKERKKHGK